MERVNQGFAGLVLLLLVPVIIAGAYVLLFQGKGESAEGIMTSPIEIYQQAKNDLYESGGKLTLNVVWDFDQQTKEWRVLGTPPACPAPFSFPAPVDTALATSVLYPGQERGGDYKPHGGFRFDGLKTNTVDVFAPFDGKLVKAARHKAMGQVQYVLYFINDCGMMYKLDHLLKVTPEIEGYISKVPMGEENDSRTTQINPPVLVKKGTKVATQVGLAGNVFMDFGVYDLRQKNGVNYSGKNYFNIEEQGEYAICWLENLQEPGRSTIKNLPGADSLSGKSSDYCKE